MKKIAILNVLIVNEGSIYKGSVLLHDDLIACVFKEEDALPDMKTYDTYDAEGLHLFPGIIDDQVHFREPGMTHKADIYSESKAAVAGGITSFMEMPNTIPQTLTQELLEAKYQLAAEKSLANFSFYMGASNDNIKEVLKTDPQRVCGIKVFMGASTGNMLVDDANTLNAIFSAAPALLAVHCEHEPTIQANLKKYRAEYGDNIPVRFHPDIRSADACYTSSAFAVELAKKHNTRLHVLHVSTARELELFENDLDLEEKRITAEVCVHHLWFDDSFYKEKGNLIRWNPAIKTKADKKALMQALLDDRLDVVATDHAPHTLIEKQKGYMYAPSGGPLVQHSLLAMLDFYHHGFISLEKIVEKMCHAPAVCFRIKERGYIRNNYKADLVLLNLNKQTAANKDQYFYKCKWSPFDGHLFQSAVMATYVNGHRVFSDNQFDEHIKGERLSFNPVH